MTPSPSGDEQHGIGVSDPVDGKFVLFSTDDGGDTWHFLESPQTLTALLGEGAFAASGTTIVPNVDAVSGSLFGGNAAFVTGGAASARIFTSSGNGKRWIPTAIPEMGGSPSRGFFSATFIVDQFSGGSGIVVGGDYSHPDKKGKYIYTNITKNLSWDSVDAEVPYLSGVSQLSEGVNVIAVGPLGCVEIEWHKGLTVRDAHCTVSLNSVSRNPAGRRTWAVGPKGVIVTTKVKTFKATLE